MMQSILAIPIFIITVLLCEWLVLGKDEFSGIYAPETDASSVIIAPPAFLITTNRLAGTTIQNQNNIAKLVPKRPGNSYHTILTRDYFDLMVEHLSTTSDELPRIHEQLFGFMRYRIRRTKDSLKSISTRSTGATISSGRSGDSSSSSISGHHMTLDSRLNDTLAVIVYSSVSLNSPLASSQSHMRKAFFEATFWSIYRYMPQVVVIVGSEKDHAAVKTMQLPYTQLVRLKNLFTDADNRNPGLLAAALGWAQDTLTKQPRSSRSKSIVSGTAGKFKYLYFTEGDLLLHLRNPEGLFESIDVSGGNFMLAPHIMTTLPVQKAIKNTELRSAFAKSPHLNMQNLTIATEHLESTHGSCCDNGRVHIMRCTGGKWYQCPRWGVRDLSPWIKVGGYGYTFPTVDTQKGLCHFSADRVLCPIPEECEYRVPPREYDGKPAGIIDVCDEQSNLLKLGPKKK